MPLLSQPAPRPQRPRRKPARALPPMAIVGATVELRLLDTLVTALADGALWIGEAKTLISAVSHG